MEFELGPHAQDCRDIHNELVPAFIYIIYRMSFLKMEPTNLNGTVKIPFHSLLGEINFRNVSFSYPSRPDQVVIDKMNLKIEAGKTVLVKLDSIFINS